MSEYNFFLMAEELVGILRDALADDFKIQVNKNLARPVPEYCKALSDIERAVNSGNHAFILERSDFSRYPVKLRPIIRGSEQLWYPRAKEGGPVIEVNFFAPFERKGVLQVPCSLFSCQAKIVNPNDGLLEPAGSAVGTALGELVSPLQLASKEIKSSRRRAFLSPSTRRALDSGARLTEPFEAAR